MGREAFASIGPASSALTRRNDGDAVVVSPAITRMHRRRSAEPGQQRPWTVDEAEAHRLQQGFAEDPSIGRDDPEIGLERGQRVQERLIGQSLWLKDRQTAGQRHGASRAAPARADHARRLIGL